jgi:DNA-binding beta-propeller fold protein YncE
MKFYFLLLSFLILLVSCNKSENDQPAGKWSNSVFIINEGPFPTGTGTVDAFDRETLEVSHDLFGSANGRPLGNIVQSLTVFKDRAFIVVNNANKIEVVNLEDFKSVATIENLVLPRYFVALDETKGYVSCWDSTVKVISLVDYSVIKSIKTGTGPDEMVLSGNFLFVINSGGFGVDSTVSVINTLTDTPYENIAVGHRPAAIRQGLNGKLWILCAGRGWNGFPDPGDTRAMIISIDQSTLAITKEVIFPSTDQHPDNLIINNKGDILYYHLDKSIYAFPVSATEVNMEPYFMGSESFYGLGYDEATDMIYATAPLDYSQNGWFYRFRAQDGIEIDAYMTGMVPNGFWFNN